MCRDSRQKICIECTMDPINTLTNVRHVENRIVPGQQPCNRRSFHIHDSIASVSDTHTYDVAGLAVAGAILSMAALRNRLNS